jgi:hypothetical protein
MGSSPLLVSYFHFCLHNISLNIYIRLIIHDFFPEISGHFLTKQLGQILENFVFLMRIQLILLVWRGGDLGKTAQLK